MADWSLTSLPLKLIKICARVVRHTRAITFQLAEVAVTGPMVHGNLAALASISAAAAMRVTAVQAKTERKQQDTSAQHTQKQGRPAKDDTTERFALPNSRSSSDRRHHIERKCLICCPLQAILLSDGRSLGECRSRNATTLNTLKKLAV